MSSLPYVGLGRYYAGLHAEHRGGGALVVVTHGPSMLEKADRVVTIRDGEIV